jgi:large subunit ribosomal protein L10
MPLTKAGKAAFKENISAKLSKANAVILAEYRGLGVGEMTELREKLREVSAEFKVINNRITKVAIDENVQAAQGLRDKLKGPIGLVLAYGDAAQIAKTVVDFGKEKEVFQVKGGLLDGAQVTDQELKAIANLPSREVLMASIVSSLISPHRGILGVLSGVPRQLVQVINAIKDKKAG